MTTPYVKIIYPKKDTWLKRFIRKIICIGNKAKCEDCKHEAK
jgi:hypothetical protein